ncbi:WxL domain-containing protein [Enterococcus pallens]|uniref:WxL domain-containing protein n=1 Tax=Enterococcus pallens ATCC BAA-351 TaxID=1158607 RepID=R2S5W0_9ENTE|nr:WxL domain-containing protein [Enterococcus pallens]EOH90875.1 hypothetical protein UAU_03414 [Enterococcus pallens ATCC BAA-351]EOU16071.1 hypothetical protein I588_03727 [Enterococcus pallens ATCC BAA-351]OJG77471.1 hypothetical protein RV10_GL002445 [Enterococcus pallens]
MKLTKVVASTVFLAALSLSAGSAVSHAAGLGSSADPAQGRASIEFEDNDNPTWPKDPTDPTKPNPNLPDGNNEETGTRGPLSLDVYPSYFDFGIQKIDMNGGTYESQKTGTHYLQITDNRDSLGGWSIVVSRTEFSDESKELTGSQLYIPEGEAKNTLAADPTVVDSSITVADATPNIEFANMHEIGKNESTLVGAVDDLNNLVGKGTTTYSWDSSEELLHIPAGAAKKGTFTSTINWVLSATPMV